MRYISLFSGIEGASVACSELGWEPVAFAEIDPFCCELLSYYYPHVPNLGDVTEIDWRKYRGKANVIVGGSPCQSFSIAGKREGTKAKDKGGLMFEYIRAVREIRPRWFVFENVPGILSDRGNAWGEFISEMAKLGYCVSWRVLDSRFFGVPQRRRRVFAVGSLRDTTSVQVLFEPESMSGDFKTSEEKWEELTAYRGANPDGTIVMSDTQGRTKIADIPCLTAHNAKDAPVLCVADDNGRPAVDENISGTLKIGGGQSLDYQLSNGKELVGSLSSSDWKGARNQWIGEGKIIAQRMS